MQTSRPFALASLVCAVILSACDKPTPPPPSQNAVTDMATDGVNDRATDGLHDIVADMQVIKLGDWPEIRKKFRGKVLVADLWASWCISCIERFPAMVELSHRYQKQAVQFISLNLDDPGDSAAIKWSNDFIKKMRADFPHYHLNENIMYSFEQLDLLGIPVVLIFDQKGKERFRLTGDNPNKQFGEDDVENAIKALIQ